MDEHDRKNCLQALVNAAAARHIALWKDIREGLLMLEQRAITPNRPVMFDGRPLKPESTPEQLMEYMQGLERRVASGVLHWITEGEIHCMIISAPGATRDDRESVCCLS